MLRPESVAPLASGPMLLKSVGETSLRMVTALFDAGSLAVQVTVGRYK